ncbi:MAG: MFS transporter [Promethearchaeati archaeon SRVP18_Atabeyarchaeia-1]
MQALLSDRRFKVTVFSLLLSELVRNLGMNFYSLSMPYYLDSPQMAGNLANAPILIGIAIGVFGLVQASTQIPLGRLSDRIGRRGILIVSGFIYASGALLVGLSQNIYEFILFRAIQATGAVVSVIQACLGDIFPSEHRGTAMAWFSIVYMIGTIVGIPVGGVVAAVFGLQLPFFIASTLGFLAALVLVASLRETLPSKIADTGAANAAKINFPRTGAMESLNLPSRSPEDRWTVASISQDPPKPKFFRARGFFETCMIAMTTSFTMGSFFAFAPIFLQEELGLSLDQALVFFIPGIIIFFVGALGSGVWSDRQGRRRPIVAGLAWAVPWFLAVPFASASLLPPIIILGLLGVAVAQTPLSALVLDLVPKEVKGNASGFFNTLTILGSSIGSIAAGFIVELYGQGTMFAFSGVLLFISLLVGVALLPRGRAREVALGAPGSRRLPADLQEQAW